MICGSRGWHDPGPIDKIISTHATTGSGDEELVIIHGHAKSGADALADRLGRQWGATVIREPADWGRYGRGAGPIRNQKMLDDHKPDAVYAFRTTGKSNGTDDMVRRARQTGLPVAVITDEETDHDAISAAISSIQTAIRNMPA